MTTATGEVSVTPGSAIGRLGDAAAAEEAAAAAAAASRDPATGEQKPAEEKPAEGEQKPAELTPEQKAQAITDAEKAVAEAKTPEEKTAAEAKLAELKGEKKAEGAPEKYEDFKLPDGQKLDEAALTDALPVFKELNLSQEQAQKLVDLQAKFIQARADKAIDDWNALLQTTEDEARADKEIGGANWDQSLGLAKVAIDKFGTPELHKYLGENQAGSHKEVIRLLAKVGKAVSEDGFVPGNAPAAAPKSAAERIYPNHPK